MIFFYQEDGVWQAATSLAWLTSFRNSWDAVAWACVFRAKGYDIEVEL